MKQVIIKQSKTPFNINLLFLGANPFDKSGNHIHIEVAQCVVWAQMAKHMGMSVIAVIAQPE
jgi:hypothetical protein